MSEEDPSNPAPGYTGEEHPELFSTIPPQPSSLKPGQVSADKVKQFYEQGFLQLDTFFTPDELSPVKDAINDLVDTIAHKLYEAGKIKSLYEEHGFEDRLTKLEADFPGANVIYTKLGTAKQVTNTYHLYFALHEKDRKISLDEAISKIWGNERLLNVVEQLLGTADIAGTPTWNIRPKVPQCQEAVVPWHQDAGYFDNSSYTSFIITAWIPLLDTNETNGCLQMAKGAHKKGKVGKHVGCWRDTWYITLEDQDLSKDLGVDMEKDIVTCSVPYGGILLFTSFTPHRGLPNLSNTIRWSFDFRWQPAHCSPGWYGMKPTVRMRSSTDPNFKIDWEPFTSVDRRKKQFEMMKTIPDEFDVTNPGPWMLKWPLVNENRHTEALKNIESTQWLNIISG